MQEKLKELDKKWHALRANPQHKKIRIKDAADFLNVSEAELLSTTINKETIFLKINNWIKFFEKICSTGQMMYLVRNDYTVHENTITINNINTEPIDNKNMLNILVLHNEQSEIAIHYDNIAYAFSTKTMIRGKEVYSFQLFDPHGTAIIKIYLKNNNQKQFDQIKNRYQVSYNYELQKLPFPYKISFNKNNTWYNSVNKNDKYKESNHFVLHSYLDDIVKSQDKIEIGVCNSSALSIYRGYIHNVIHKFNWLNIMDNTFNLHIKDDKINSVLEKYSNKKIIELFNNKMHMLHLQK